MLNNYRDGYTRTLLGIISAVLLTLSLSGTPALAASLSDLRASGAIGEGYNGYVVARNPSAQAEADAINSKRKAVYEGKAAAQGADIVQVGKVYAAEILKKVPVGTWIQKENGEWVQK